MATGFGQQRAAVRDTGTHLLAARVTSWLLVLICSLQALLSWWERPEEPSQWLTRVLVVALLCALGGGFLWWQAGVLRGASGNWLRQLAVFLAAGSLVAAQGLGLWTFVAMALTALVLSWPWRLGAALAAGVWALLIGLGLLSHEPLQTTLLVGLTTLVIACGLLTITELARLAQALQASREELARVHVDKERERISRDLHDIIGRVLVAASLRNQSALRLLEQEKVSEATGQLEAAHSTLDEGQKQLRALTRGPIQAGLDFELRNAVALCANLGIECQVRADPVTDTDLERVLALVLREAVTNMLKHSLPTTCRITITQAADGLALEMVNDGVPRGSSMSAHGTGLAGLQRRLDPWGGQLSVTPSKHQSFVLTVRVPANRDPEPTGDGSGDDDDPDR